MEIGVYGYIGVIIDDNVIIFIAIFNNESSKPTETYKILR